MKPKVHKGSMGAAANGGSRKLFLELSKSLPFYVFHGTHARPGELIFFSFQKILCKVVLFIIMFSLLKSFNCI